MAASLHGDTPYSGKAVTSVPATPYTTSVDVNAQVLGREVLEFAAWTCGPASGKFAALRRPVVMRLDAALRPRLCHQARRLGTATRA